MTSNTRVLIADDHEIVLEGLKEILVNSDGIDVVGAAIDGPASVEMAKGLRPDVVIMDVMMPHKNGIDACREIIDLLPDTRVIILTASPSMSAVVEAMAAGADGFVHKYSSKETLIDTLRAVSAGKHAIPSDLIKQAFSMMRKKNEQLGGVGVDSLTRREQAILRMFSQGNSYKEIAALRGNKPLTIRNAIYHIQNKLRVTSKQEMVVWAVRSGLLDDKWDLPEGVQRSHRGVLNSELARRMNDRAQSALSEI